MFKPGASAPFFYPVFAALLLVLFTGCAAKQERFQSQFFGYFDTLTIIIGYAGSEAEFTEYAEVIRARMAELHQLYDIYHEYPGINNLYTVNKNAGAAPVQVDQDIIDLLVHAQEGYEATGGIINPAMGSVLKIWHNYRESGINAPETAELPPMETLKAAAQNISMNDVVIDAEAGTVFITNPEVSLDVGAMAKSYAEGLAVQAAKDAGMESAIISAGGNITTVGKPMDGARDRWNIGIQDPEQVVTGTQNTIDLTYFNDKTMSVSGGYERYYEVDGKAYHHIIDPETLMPATGFKQVAVIHGDAFTADLLSTALFILPYEEGRALAEKMNADALWVDINDNWFYTDGYAAISRELSNYSSTD